jgi:hypothetical protein
MAERSKALRSGRSPDLWAWVQIPLLTFSLDFCVNFIGAQRTLLRLPKTQLRGARRPAVYSLVISCRNRSTFTGKFLRMETDLARLHVSAKY